MRYIYIYIRVRVELRLICLECDASDIAHSSLFKTFGMKWQCVMLIIMICEGAQR